jgi:hypothetical protein
MMFMSKASGHEPGLGLRRLEDPSAALGEAQIWGVETSAVSSRVTSRVSLVAELLGMTRYVIPSLKGEEYLRQFIANVACHENLVLTHEAEGSPRCSNVSLGVRTG